MPWDDAVAKMRTTLQGDDQRLFDPNALMLDGWTQTTIDRKLAWKGRKECPPAAAPERAALPATASLAEQAWVKYLAEMADPKKWAKRQRRRAFLLGSRYAKWSREQNLDVLASRADPDEQELFDPELLKDDGWAVD